MRRKIWGIMGLALLLTACQSAETQNIETESTSEVLSESEVLTESEVESQFQTETESETESVKDTDDKKTSEEQEESEFNNDVGALTSALADIYKDVSEHRVPKDVYVPNGSTPQEIVDIIQGTGRFVNTDDNNKSITLAELKRAEYGEVFTPGQYVLVDLDLDGYNELLIYGVPESTEIFHYEDGIVYGYEFNYKGTSLVTTNGELFSSGGASSGEYYRLDFTRDSYTEKTLIQFDNMPLYEEYKVLGVAVRDIPSKVFELGVLWSYDKDGILAVIAREEAYAKEAEEYIKSQSVSQAIVEAVLKQEESIHKYTISDINKDGVNEVITYHGELIPLATIYYEDKGQLRTYTMLESMIWFVNEEGVCYQMGANEEQISCRYEFFYGSLQTKEINKMYVISVEDAGKIVCEMNGEETSLANYLAYHKELWDERIPCARDLSLLK